MKIAVRYQSRGGNNKMVAEAVASAVGVEAKSITEKLSSEVDVLFLGGGVYAMQIDDELRRFLDQLDPAKIGAIVPFACVGMVKTPIRQIKKAARAKGIQVLGPLPVIRLGFSHSAKPSQAKLSKLQQSARDLVSAEQRS